MKDVITWQAISVPGIAVQDVEVSHQELSRINIEYMIHSIFLI